MTSIERGDTPSEMTIRDLGNNILGTDAEATGAESGGVMAHVDNFSRDKDTSLMTDGPCCGPVPSQTGDAGERPEVTIGQVFGWLAPMLRESRGGDNAEE